MDTGAPVGASNGLDTEVSLLGGTRAALPPT
jgi:hypothetical protein